MRHSLLQAVRVKGQEAQVLIGLGTLKGIFCIVSIVGPSSCICFSTAFRSSKPLSPPPSKLHQPIRHKLFDLRTLVLDRYSLSLGATCRPQSSIIRQTSYDSTPPSLPVSGICSPCIGGLCAALSPKLLRYYH